MTITKIISSGTIGAESAKLLARQFHAGIALKLVHSFSPEEIWLNEYAKFAALFGITPEMDKIHPDVRLDGLVLYLGWAKGDKEYLSK